MTSFVSIQNGSNGINYNYRFQRMSIKAVVEMVLHLDNYYIIEYPHQGFFSFHCSIYQDKGDTMLTAIPYQILPNQKPQPSELFNRVFAEPRLEDQKAISSTALAKYSGILILYKDEVIPLDNWFSLRMELQAFPQLQSEDIFMKVELRLNNKDLSIPQMEGTLIETVTFRLNDLQNGIFHFVQANFQAPYVSKLNFTLFSYLCGFRFSRYQPLVKELTKDQKVRQNIHSINQLLSYASSTIKLGEIQKVFYSNYIKKLRIYQYLMQQRIFMVQKHPKPTEIKISQDYLGQAQIERATTKDFKDYLDNFHPKKLTADSILKEFNDIRQENFYIMQATIKEWMLQQIDLEKMKQEYLTFGRQKYGEMVFKSTVIGTLESTKEKSYHENKKVAEQMRNKNIVLNSYPLEDVRFQEKKEEQELVFYEITHPFTSKEEQKKLCKMTEEEEKILLSACKYQYSEKHMLIVLCHGYQGASYDMSLIKRWIQQQLPDAYYLVCRSNQDDTDGDIRKMGQNVAEQIEKYITNCMEEYEQENVILNFVGHSMGGVIARAALPHLEKYKEHMGFFCSLSSPHLGYLNGVSKLIKVGFWALRTFKKIYSLEQLSMEESGDPRKTFLYELSKTGHLRYFRKIILLSSYEDSYCSWHSARISTHRNKNARTRLEEEMVESILENNIYGASIHRLDINFNVREKNLDSFIGRTAHINLIIRQNLFKTLSITLPKLFELTEFGRQGLFL